MKTTNENPSTVGFTFFSHSLVNMNSIEPIATIEKEKQHESRKINFQLICAFKCIIGNNNLTN